MEAINNSSNSSADEGLKGVKIVEPTDFNGIDEELESFKQDEVISLALQQGVDLRAYTTDIDNQLRDVEAESVREYVSQSDKVLELHSDIQACDAILARMQEMLLGFQADLGGISDEIKNLQDESISMNIRLKNRRAAEEKLGSFLGNVVLPPSLASAICADSVNDAYLDYIIALNSKVKYLNQTKPAADGSSLDVAPKDTTAAKEIGPHLEQLRAQACTKARDYLLAKIGDLRKPKTNIQIMQKNSLLKFSFLMDFLNENAPSMALEARTFYVESMGRTIYNVFRLYHMALIKRHSEVANRHDLLAVEEAAVRGIFSSKVDLSKRGDAFNLGDREYILDQVDAQPILVHVAQAEEQHYTYEVIMRSVMKHLMDSATSEYLFTLEFFKGSSRETFNQIFAKTLSLCLENLENYLSPDTCFDSIGLLLMIKLTLAHRLVMQRRRVPVLDSFFDRVNMLLWGRFKKVFDANLKSVETANAKKLGIIERHPHYVTRRYAEFTASILALHSGVDSGAGLGGEEMLLNDLAQLRTEIVRLLQRMSERLGPHKEKERMVFLINNYDQVLTVFNERRIMSDETSKFEDLLHRQREVFVEEELMERFGQMIAFVKRMEVSADEPLDEVEAEDLVREFASTWMAGIEGIHADILAFFSNFRNGMEILKQALTQLLLYNTRFQERVRRGFQSQRRGQQPPFFKDIVSTQAILQEIKKYSRTFS